jgi:hypothetical protein
MFGILALGTIIALEKSPDSAAFSCVKTSGTAKSYCLKAKIVLYKGTLTTKFDCVKTQGLLCFNVQTHTSPPEAPVDAVFYCVKLAGILAISCLKAQLAAMFLCESRGTTILLSIVT